MAYRILKQPGNAPGAGGNQVQLRGLKITTKADIAVNRMLTPQQSAEAQNLYVKIREGSAPTNSGTYNINGFTCFHAKFDGQAHALCWRAPPKDPYVYIEAVIKKTGKGNEYGEV